MRQLQQVDLFERPLRRYARRQRNSSGSDRRLFASIRVQEVRMSTPQLRRADRVMPEPRAREMLARGFSGRLATMGEDGYPYCIPLLYIWMDGKVYVHTSSARGHFRANVES